MHSVQSPLVQASVLHLLHPRNRHATRIAEKIWNDVDALLVQNFVGFGRCWAVRKLGNDLGGHLPRIVSSKDVFKRSRNQDIDIEGQDCFVRNFLRASEPCHLAG